MDKIRVEMLKQWRLELEKSKKMREGRKKNERSSFPRKIEVRRSLVGGVVCIKRFQ